MSWPGTPSLDRAWTMEGRGREEEREGDKEREEEKEKEEEREEEKEEEREERARTLRVWTPEGRVRAGRCPPPPPGKIDDLHLHLPPLDLTLTSP